MAARIQGAFINEVVPVSSGPITVAVNHDTLAPKFGKNTAAYDTFGTLKHTSGWGLLNVSGIEGTVPWETTLGTCEHAISITFGGAGTTSVRGADFDRTLNNMGEEIALSNGSKTIPRDSKEVDREGALRTAFDQHQDDRNLCGVKRIIPEVPSPQTPSARHVPHHLTARLAHHHPHQQQRTA